MHERLNLLLEAAATREYGGTIPDAVWAIAHKAGTEIRQAILRQDPKFDREKLYAIEMNAVDTALRVACQTLFERRFRHREFGTGFGTVSDRNGREA